MSQNYVLIPKQQIKAKYMNNKTKFSPAKWYPQFYYIHFKQFFGKSIHFFCGKSYSKTQDILPSYHLYTFFMHCYKRKRHE